MKNITSYLIIILSIVVLFFINDYVVKKRQLEISNQNEINFKKELNNLKTDIIEYVFDKNELADYLKNTKGQLKDLEEQLKKQGIQLKQINKIVSTQITSTDSTDNLIVLDSLNKILTLLQENKTVKIPFTDKTDCFFIKGVVTFENGSTVNVELTDREYTDTINTVSYWQRRQWKLLGLINTRLFGKKTVELTLISNCGNTQTFVIDRL